MFERHNLKSLMCSRNKRGPIVEPWGTPLVTSAIDESNMFNETNCFLFDPGTSVWRGKPI